MDRQSRDLVLNWCLPVMAKSRNRVAAEGPPEGDMRSCPFCRGVMRFEQSGEKGAEAGWSCSCGNRVSLRQETLVERRRILTERRISVVRKSMKVRALAHRLLRDSERLAERRHGKK